MFPAAPPSAKRECALRFAQGGSTGSFVSFLARTELTLVLSPLQRAVVATALCAVFNHLSGHRPVDTAITDFKRRGRVMLIEHCRDERETSSVRSDMFPLMPLLRSSGPFVHRVL